MENEEEFKNLNWDKIHEMVVEKGSSAISGVGPNDVDWFLRDSKVSSDPRKQENYGSAPPSPKTQNHLPLSTPASPHMASTLSNANENNISKSRPSISPITEEPATSDTFIDNATSGTFSRPRRRSSVSSTTSINSNGSSGSGGGGGLFQKLKSKFHRSASHEHAPHSPTVQPQLASSSKSDSNTHRLSRTISPLQELGKVANPIERTLSHTNSLKRAENSSSTSSFTSSSHSNDPRIDDYVKFYKQPDSQRKSGSFSCASNRRSFGEKPNGETLESCLLNPLPAHKAKAAVQEALQASTGSKLGSLWRRRSVSASQTPQVSETRSLERSTESADSEPSRNAPPENIPYGKDLKPLKRVAFHSLTFLIDPPQQIPSRHPRKGNVEVLPGGVVRVNPLTEADKQEIEKSQKGLGGGLVVGGTGALGLVHEDTPEHDPSNEVVNGNQDEAPDDGKDEINPDAEQDTEINKHAKGFAIDKPMIHNKARQGYTVPIKKMALDLMYTRCCHLREILPIPAIAKQIPKGTMAPLPLLQLRNPHPTMIEIQTFGDFIRIAPISCLSLDGVSLSLEQFRILLCSISSKTQLKKLSLRNTPINAEGWSLLCWFLSRNVHLRQLDITQCPPLSINLLKKKNKPQNALNNSSDEIPRMTCNNENRSDMDWASFTATIIARGGIDELVLTGCCINDLDIFNRLVGQALAIKTYRLGLAYNKLLPQQIRILMEKWVLTDKARGLDLGYNDMLSSSYVNTMLDIMKHPTNIAKIRDCPLAFLSLNATDLRFNSDFREFFEKFVLALPNLKYLDLSNDPKLFGNFHVSTPADEKAAASSQNDTSGAGVGGVKDQDAICDYFTSKLPLFNNLMRLHLENNAITSKSLVSISQIIPFCKQLRYLSVIGNELDVLAGSALVEGLKNSSTLITLDLDLHLLPDLFKERIGLYTMRNMDKMLSHPEDNGIDAPQLGHGEQEDSLSAQLQRILTLKAENKLDVNSSEVMEFGEKAKRDREKLKSAIGELLHMQWKNQLSIEGKETLIRLLFIDASLQRGLKLIDTSIGSDEDNVNHSHYMDINLAEKEGLDNHVNTLKPEGFGDQQETKDLLESSSLPFSRSQSLTSLNTLDKEEGSILKLRRLHGGGGEFLDKLQTYSGEELRQRLMDVDLSKLDRVIDYISHIKKDGLSIKSLFNESTDRESDDTLGEFRQRLEQLLKLLPNDADNNKDSKLIVDPMKSESGLDLGQSLDEKNINDTLDQVLSRYNSHN